LLKILHYCPISPRFQHIAQLTGSLAWHPFSTPLPASLADNLQAFKKPSVCRQNCKLLKKAVGRHATLHTFKRPKLCAKAGSLLQAKNLIASFPRNYQNISILSIVYKLIAGKD
jgi:hypothetical protein